MLDIGWSEMAVIALVALIVIGPKELPNAMRLAAKWVRKARGLAREFQSGIDDMIREAELQEAREAVDSARNMDLDKAFDTTVDPTGSVREEAEDLHRTARGDASGDGSAGTTKDAAAKESGPEQPGVTESGAKESGADESEPKAAGEGPSEPRATVVEHPVNVAPPHSIAPPPEPAAAGAEEPKSPPPEAGSQKSA